MPTSPTTERDARTCEREVRRYMRNHAPDYETPTALVEGAVIALNLKAPGESHPIWEWALEHHPYD